MTPPTWSVRTRDRRYVAKLVPAPIPAPTAGLHDARHTRAAYAGRGSAAQVVQDERIDAAGRDPLLQVLDAGPVGQGGVEVVLVEAEIDQPGADLLGQRPGQLQQGVRIGLLEQQRVQVQQAAELGAGIGVVVAPQIHGDVAGAAVSGAWSDDEERGALATPAVAAGLVAGPQRRHEP